MRFRDVENDELLLYGRFAVEDAGKKYAVS